MKLIRQCEPFLQLGKPAFSFYIVDPETEPQHFLFTVTSVLLQMKKINNMNDPQNFDWRIFGVTRLSANWGGYKKGTPIRPTIGNKNKEGVVIRFEPPRIQSLAFNIAINAANEAEKIRSTISLIPTTSGARKVTDKNLANLYDYFEYCMITVTFSYQALETFANHVISKNLKDPYELKKVKCGKEETQYLDSEELQRYVSTDEKLKTILPKILHMKSPKETKIWPHYKELKKMRDATIHLKPSELDYNDLERESIYFLLYYCNPKDIVIKTLEMVEYFTNEINEKQWSDKIRTIINSNEQKDRYFDY